MTASLSSLHKILKDETRRDILVAVNQGGTVSYTELLNSMDSVSTGLLNYHLKVLGDLLIKDEGGRYLLSEKGKVALNLIIEFPSYDLSQRKILYRRLYIVLGIGQAAYFAVALAFYFSGFIDLYRLTMAAVANIMATITLYFMWRIRRNFPPGTMPPAGSPEMYRRIRIGYIAGGMSGGLLVAFFGGGMVLRLLSDAQGIRFSVNNPLYQLFWSPAYLVFSLLIAPAIGVCIAYYLGRRQGFEKPKWAIWLDTHLG